MNKNIKIYIIIFMMAVAGTMIFCKFCTNIDNEFDNSIFWNAISTITGIMGFGGVIYTLYYNEKIRTKQNEYELRREWKIGTVLISHFFQYGLKPTMLFKI